MSEPTPPTTAPFPTNWLIGQDYNPNEHLIQLERFDKRTNRKITSDYLNVQGRVMWFIRDQRALTVAGLAKVPYVIQTELVEIDREQGWAQFKTYVRDVLGNEATMYGSESVKDFGDYAEKASTKGLGRALMMLGYFVGFAAELDEGDRVVDAPQERTTQPQRTATNTTPAAQIAPQPLRTIQPAGQRQQRADANTKDTDLATIDQLSRMKNLYTATKQPEPSDLDALTFGQAKVRLNELSTAFSALKTNRGVVAS